MTNKKGFSLVELLVAMAIIAVLISIAAIGIQTVQRNSRNTIRRTELSNLNMAITEAELNSPGTATIAVSGNAVTVTSGGVAGTPYNVNGSFSTVTLTAAGTCTAAAETAPKTITICYKNTSPRQLVVNLEGSSAGARIDIGS